MLHSLVNVAGKDFLVDNSTGEVLKKAPEDGRPVWVSNRKMRDKSFVILMDMDLQKLAGLHLSPTAWRIFYLLLQVCEFENWVHVNQSQVADKLKLTRQAVYTAMKQLVAAGIVRREKDRLEIERWRIDPAIAWRGSIEDQMKAMNAFDLESLHRGKHNGNVSHIFSSTESAAKCSCGASLTSASQISLNEFLYQHSTCDIEIDYWEEVVDLNQSRP